MNFYEGREAGWKWSVTWNGKCEEQAGGWGKHSLSGNGI